MSSHSTRLKIMKVHRNHHHILAMVLIVPSFFPFLSLSLLPPFLPSSLPPLSSFLCSLLSHLSFLLHPAHRPVPVTSDMELSVMKNKIAELKAQLGKGRERAVSQPDKEGLFVS